MNAWLTQHRAAFVQAVRRLAGNPFNTLLSLFAIGIAMTLPAFGYIVLDNLRSLGHSASGGQQISVFMAQDASTAQVDEIRQRLQQLPGVNTRFVPRAEALERLQAKQDLADIVASLPRNPLPDAFIVEPADISPAALDTLRNEIADWPKVAHVQLDTAWVKRFDAFLRLGKLALTLLAALFAIDPAHFLRETHRFPDLERLIAFEKPVRHALQRLPGRKLLFTNAPLAYAETVLGLTGLDSLFAAVYSVESLNFQPKPMLAAYRNLLRVERLSPRRCIMVEDSLANLVTAKTLGMKTVWVSTGLRDSPSVDVKVRSVRELPRHLNRL